MRIDVFGTVVEASKSDAGWKVFYSGDEGVKRPATDIVIPRHVDESEVLTYLADLRHEFATPRHPKVEITK